LHFDTFQKNLGELFHTKIGKFFKNLTVIVKETNKIESFYVEEYNG